MFPFCHFFGALCIWSRFLPSYLTPIFSRFSVCQNKVIWDMNWVIWTLPISGIVGVLHDHPSQWETVVKRRKQRRWVWILFGVGDLGYVVWGYRVIERFLLQDGLQRFASRWSLQRMM